MMRLGEPAGQPWRNFYVCHYVTVVNINNRVNREKVGGHWVCVNIIMALNKKTIDKVDVKGKRVLMRYIDLQISRLLHFYSFDG